VLQKVGPVRLVFRHTVEPVVSLSIWSRPLFEQDVWMKKEFNYRRTHCGDVTGCALVRMMGVPACFILRLLCNVTRAEISFRFAAERTSLFLQDVTVQSAVGSQGVRFSFQCTVELERFVPHS
jgi:hypothetical protein